MRRFDNVGSRCNPEIFREMKAQAHDAIELKELAQKLYDDIMPQIGKLAIQDYQALNELGILLSRLDDETKSGGK